MNIWLEKNRKPLVLILAGGALLFLLVGTYKILAPSDAPIAVLGGAAESSDRNAQLIVPPRALDRDVAITIRQTARPALPHGLNTIGNAYQINPSGITFSRPATVRLTYNEQHLPEDITPKDLFLVTVTSEGQVEVLQHTNVDSETQTVSGQTPHLSVFAIAYVSSEAGFDALPNLNFGEQLAGTTHTWTIPVSNSSDEEAVITAIRLVSLAGEWSDPFSALAPAFSLSSLPDLPLTLAAGENTTVMIDFHPPGADDYAATILVGTEHASTRFTLGGTGVFSIGGATIIPDLYTYQRMSAETQENFVPETGTLILKNEAGMQIQVASVEAKTNPSSTGSFDLETAPATPITLSHDEETPLHVTYTPETMDLEFGYLIAQGTDTQGEPVGASSRLINSQQNTEHGERTGAPMIEVDSLAFDTAGTLVGTTDTLQTTVRNIGTFDFDLLTTIAVPPPFGPQNPFANLVIGPIRAGSSEFVDINFTPQARGPYLGFIDAEALMGTDVVWDISTATGHGVAAELALSPDPVHFGAVQVEESETITITASNTGDFDLTRIEFSELPSAPFEAAPDIPDSLDQEGSFAFPITFTPTEEGAFADSLTITAAFQYRGQELTWSVSLSMTGEGFEVPADPHADIIVDDLDFGDVLVWSTDVRTIPIINTGTVPLFAAYAVTGAGFGPPPATLGVIRDGASQQAEVRFTPRTRGPHNGTITATGISYLGLVQDAAQLTGRGVAPDLTFEPRTIDFGTLCIGDSDTLRVTVTNTGDFDLVIDGYDFPRHPFEVISTIPRNLILAIGESYEYVVRYDATPGFSRDSFFLHTTYEYRSQDRRMSFGTGVIGEGVVCQEEGETGIVPEEDTSVMPEETEPAEEPGETTTIEMLILNGQYFPKVQFRISGPEEVTADGGCPADHYHGETVYGFAGRESAEIVSTTDPAPQACGFGTVGEVPVETIPLTEEQYWMLLELLGSF